jgi:hypothetical protein
MAGASFGFARPLAVLAFLVATSGGFSNAFLAAHQATPSSIDKPWSIALYTDEIVAGNVLSHQNNRKAWGTYWSFLEFGTGLLSHEAMWLVLTAARSKNVGKLAGSLSEFMVCVLKELFDESSFDMRAGILLTGPNGLSFMFVATLALVIADIDAHKKMFEFREVSRACYA